jgi:hypothetical protein
MFALIFLVGILVVCVLAAFYGVDSRHDEPGRHHPTLL